ncbi:hypothetical protein HY489_01975 [Candidatus Woesearchaeota archaeon]|nr:hypothetical protein [Candidatus Woesearchaeota archaeon]
MKWAYKVFVRLLARDGELNDVLEGLKALTSVPPKVEAVEDSTNKVCSVEIAKESDANDLLKRVLAGIGDQKQVLLQQTESRVHEEEGDFYFYIRLDKPAWLKEKKMVLTEGGNCVHIRVMLAVFPKKQLVAVRLVERLLKEM